tara:strand:+ start:1576 stop:1881 length:306 start_codon:yes stop_codon:yes gene_type:complete
MIEWIIIAVLTTVLLSTLYVFRNMIRTLNNINAALVDFLDMIEEYEELVQTLNNSETYYGDPTIESFVKISNELKDNLGGIVNIQKQLMGELDAEEEKNEA